MRSGAHSSEEKESAQRTSWTPPQSQRSLKQKRVRRQREQISALAFHFVAMRHQIAQTEATAQTGSERAAEEEDEDEVDLEEVFVMAVREESAESAARKRLQRAKRGLLAVGASVVRVNTGNTLREELHRAPQLAERVLLAEAVEAGADAVASAGKEVVRDALIAARARVEAGSAEVEADSEDLPLEAPRCRLQATLATATNALATSTYRPKWISQS